MYIHYVQHTMYWAKMHCIACTTYTRHYRYTLHCILGDSPFKNLKHGSIGGGVVGANGGHDLGLLPGPVEKHVVGFGRLGRQILGVG